MDDEDLPEISGWLAALFTFIAIPGLTLVALRLLSAKVLNFAGECVIRLGCALTKLAYYLNDD